MSCKSAVTIVLLPGSWHQPVHYDRLTQGLRAQGYKVICHSHPTNSGLKTLADDVEFVRHLVGQEIEQGQTVDIITHSYGGIVAAGAFGGMGRATRAKAGQSGGVRNLLGMTTFLPPSGKSLETMLAPMGLPSWIVPDDNGTSHPENPEKVFYHDLTENDRQWAVKMLAPQATKATKTVVDEVCWSEFENAYYLKCTEDQAIPLPAQDLIVDGFQKMTGKEVKVRVLHVSHSPMYFEQCLDWAIQIIGT